METADSINAKFNVAPVATAASTPAPVAEQIQQQTPASTMADVSNEQANPATSQKNLLLLLDVPITVSVILGKTKLLLRDILNLGIGSIIELNKSFNEPVDLAAGQGHKPIARGEVVVVDENFGLRLTELVSPLERLELIKKEG